MPYDHLTGTYETENTVEQTPQAIARYACGHVTVVSVNPYTVSGIALLAGYHERLCPACRRKQMRRSSHVTTHS